VAEITRERQGQIIEAVLAVLKDQPDGLAAREVLSRVRTKLPPTEFELADYPNSPGVQRFDKIIRFTTIGPVKAGWMVKDRGTWAITEAGKAVIGTFADPADLMREAVRLYRKWKSTQPDTGDDSEEVDEADASDAPSVALELAEESAWQEISSYLSEMPPYEFQQLVADLLKALGYHIVWVAPPGPDQGVDVIAGTDLLGTAGPRIKVQVKRHQGRVSPDGIRSFMAVLGTNDIGLFVNVGGFTPEAQREARTQETRRLTLLGAQQFVDLWIEHYGELTEEARQRLPLKPVHFLAPPE
jgi:restriction system protein